MEDLPPKRFCVLIVEDDRVTARDLEATLLRRGFSVCGIAHTASEAKSTLEEKRADLVLLDIHLGGNAAEKSEPGIDLAIELRDIYSVPVVFITGYSREALSSRAAAAEPIGFLRKPFSDAEVATCIEAVAERLDTGEKLSARIPGIKAVSESIPQSVIASDLNGRVVYLNNAAEALTGWSKTDGLGAELSHILPFENAETSHSGDAPHKRATLRNKHGMILSVEERSAPIKTEGGEAIGVITVVSEAPEADLPDQTEADLSTPPARSAALQSIANLSKDPAFRDLLPAKAKETNSTSAPELPPVTYESASATPLIDDVSDPILTLTDDEAISYANAEALSLFGKDHSVVGEPLQELFDAEDLVPVEDEFLRPLGDGRRNRFEFHDSRRNTWFEVHAYRNKGGVLILFSDITARKSESAEVVRQQRLEGLGLLARGFAHDFNNHLTSLTGNLSLAKERHEDDVEQREMLDEALAAASRATGLVQQLMTFARGGHPIRERSRVADLIRRVLTDHRIQHPEIRYQFQGPEEELIANLDPAQISRLIENLVSNSAEAMPQGGVLVVRCRKIEADRVRDIKGSHRPADEEHFLIEVIDTGRGISTEHLNRVFEPYFSDRKDDNATGIGLTVCESIAKAHGGFVHLQSKEGKGTIASFCAPLGRHPHVMEENAVEVDSSTYPNLDFSSLPINGSRKSSETIFEGTRVLILEDDAPIRRLMAATLRRAGHEIVETKDGRDTIAAYKEAKNRGDGFDLVICDLTIENGVGGVETMRQIVEYDPNVVAIVSSGYSDAPAMSNPRAYGFSAVLPKPYAPSELRAAVQRIVTISRSRESS